MVEWLGVEMHVTHAAKTGKATLAVERRMAARDGGSGVTTPSNAGGSVTAPRAA